ncbi:hypothetical protein RhiirA1_535873 [Rhizophagus irregularis]|uniref:Uncharacterized protein n=1 Tax=Rhizophagus irregularis TaxID=588596 RepID=A0A2I1E3G2_9GLOM|nr:hypothetical protein RhiirA1_535873 [Rhizophagus irregularis]PKY16645.1 hypothetical protein RhiirB3_521332 [Rhizophagus irregularis]CAB4489732.1 unnamed protein product [Rhizophagus irregularis]CAB5368657.1 unnamed protein product [Rhizophagus irregularis]
MSYVIEVNQGNYEQETPNFGSIAKDYHDACEIYNSCLITTEYGDSILDPKKCNAINFDPIKTAREQYDRIYLIDELFNKIKKEKGARAVSEEWFAALPEQFKPANYYACLSTDEKGKSYLDPEKCKKNFDPIKYDLEKYDRALDNIYFNDIKKENAPHSAGKEWFVPLPERFKSKCELNPDIFIPKSQRVVDEPTKNLLLEKGIELFGHQIKLININSPVEVVEIKITQDNILLVVEEELDKGMLRYEVDCEIDMIPL